MNAIEIGREIAQQFLREANSPRTIAIFVGRLQPFHQGHYSIYKHLVDKFGAENVYIGTSNVTDPEKSPFGFNEKKKIITTMFNVPPSHVVQVKNPFKPVEILSKFPDNTRYVTAFSQKDAGRLGNSGKYFKKYDPKLAVKGYKDAGYFVVPPVLNINVEGENISGTQLRKVLGNPKMSPEVKRSVFTQVYGKYNPEIFKMVTTKLTPKVNDKFDWNDKSGQEKHPPELPLSDKTKKAARFSLNKKVRNPETGRDILVRSALEYDKSHPAYKAARASLSEALLVETNVKRRKLLEQRILLMCGGAAGHMHHPFEDMDLTFGDLKLMIELGLNGGLSIEAPITEKLDGQAISVSWKNGHAIFARNKGHLKNYGQNALTVNGIISMFSGRGALSDSFSTAAIDLENSIGKLSDKQKTKIFGEGKKFMSVEVIFPATQNVIPYGTNMLIFHNTVEYDEQGNPIGYGDSEGSLLGNMIKQVNANVQKTYHVQGPQIVILPKSRSFDSSKAKYLGKLNALQQQFKLKDNDPVLRWHEIWWDNFVTNKASSFQYPMPNYVLVGLVNRWAAGDSSYTISDMKNDITNKKFLDWAISFDKGSKDDQLKENLKPFESLFLELGSEILKNAQGLMSVNPDAAVQSMAKELDRTSGEMKGSTDIKKLQKFKTQLERLNSIGGEKAIAPTEGIVFMFKGKIFKMSGAFASLNQLLGLLRF